MDPNSENHSLDDLEKQLQDAARKLLDGDPSVENELERLDKAIKQHPEHAERVAVAEHKWELDQDASNRRALDTTRRFVPRDIFKSTASTVERRYAVRAAADRVPRRAAAALSKRVWTTSVLWLVHLEEARIKKLHPADLRSRYAVAGLDIVELRAVYAVLPIAFDNDSDGSKAKWREGIRLSLIHI